MEFKEIQQELQKSLKPERYIHTLGVVETAKQLARLHHVDVTKAAYAALLHDCAKHLTKTEHIALCQAHQVPISTAEYANPALLHAKTGAILAKTQYGIADEEILHAIAVHTTGVPAMSDLDQIVFIADYIEPGRSTAPHLDQLRALACTDLTGTTARILSDTIDYLRTTQKESMDATTVEAYEYYCKYLSL